MSKFETPQPITANIEPGNGYVTIIAGDRVDTVVDIRPTNPENESDTDAAERTTVDFAGNTLTIRGPKLNPFSWSNKTRSIDVTIEVPTGSHIHGKSRMGDLTSTGRLGDVSYKTGLGHVQFDEAATVSVTTATGNVLGNRITGNATITTASGRLHVGELADRGVLNNSNGITVVGAARGRSRSAPPTATSPSRRRPTTSRRRPLTARSGCSTTVRGSLTLETAMGEIEVGVHEGSAAWLDVKTKFGLVRNEMSASGAPADRADKVEIHANTAFGDVTVRRA